MNHGPTRMPEGDVVVYDDCDEACRYQIERIREWETSGSLTFVPLSDPRVLMWYGDQGELVSSGMIAFIGADGERACGAEALEWIIHRLPSGRSRMLVDVRGSRSGTVETPVLGSDERSERGRRSVDGPEHVAGPRGGALKARLPGAAEGETENGQRGGSWT